MKRTFLLLSSLFSITVFAQTIPNADFENWTSATEPSNWTVRNAGSLTIFGAPSTVSKSTNKFSGSFALKVQNSKGSYTNKLGTKVDTLFGGIVTTDVSIKGRKAPGYLRGHINYSLAAGEIAEISVAYKETTKNGFRTRLEALKQFTGTSGAYVPFSIPISPYYHPDRFSDTLFVSICSYRFETNQPKPVSELSSLIVDSLGFVGTMPNLQVPALGNIVNGNFESWTTVNNTKEADNWYIYGTTGILGTNNVSQTTDSYNGNFAMKLTQNHVDDAGIVYTMTRAASDSKYINGYAKFSLSSIAKDSINASVYKYSNQQIGDKILGTKKFGGIQNTFTPFSIALDNTVQPGDTLMILFYYGHNESTSSDISTFTFDDLIVDSKPTGIEDEVIAFSSTNISPNPSSSGIFQITNMDDTKNLKVYNSQGLELTPTISHINKTTIIDLSSHERGVYFVRFENERKSFRIVY